MRLAATVALLGVALAGGVQASEEVSFTERLEDSDREIERQQREAERIEADIEALDARIDEDLASPETARRARDRLRERLTAHFGAWDRQQRRVARGEGGATPQQVSDTATLLATAEPRAHRQHAEDIDSMAAIESDLRRLNYLVERRARWTVELAARDGETAVDQRERDELTERARDPEHSEEREEEVERTDNTLRNSLGILLKNETLYDFHQLRGTLLPPVPGEIAHEYGPRKLKESMTHVRHTGLTWEVESGTPVEAVGPGMVVFADRFEGFGKLVIIDHGQDYHTLYAHLDAIEVEMGERVKRGGSIGESGESGSFEGPKLYFELRKDGQPVDPTPWFIQR
ncbi:MAG: murein hydrolase activator EnvC family protein [Persicimonas sp.]